MNRNEYMAKLKTKLNTEYSWLHDEHKKMEIDANSLLIDIFTDEDAFTRFKAMCKSQEFDGMPDRVLGPDELDELFDIAGMFVNYDILDDGEMHVIRDRKTGKWFLDRTYEFMDYAEQMCRFYGIAAEDAEIAGIDGWSRNHWKDSRGNSVTTLGLEDFVMILDHVKKGDLDSIRPSLEMSNLKDRLAAYMES